MSWVGIITAIVVVAAALIGALIFAARRGRLSGRVAWVLGTIIVLVASVALIYPAMLTTSEGQALQTAEK